MKTKTTIILLILAIALGIYIFFIERKLPTTDEIEQARGKLFPHLKSEDITRIEINSPNASQMTLGVITPTTPTRITIICLRGGDDKWEMTQPLKTRADGNIIDSVCRQLSELEKKDTVKEAVNLVPYGLNEPIITVAFTTKDNKNYTLKLGKEAPLDLGVYLMIEPQIKGQKEIYVVQKFLTEAVNKPVSDFRYKNIFDINIYDATTLKFVYPEQTVELRKKGNDWFITQPVAEEMAEQTKIKDIVSTLSTLSVSTFVADYETDIKKYGLDNPKMKLVVVDPKDANKSEVLLLGDEKEKERFLAIKEGTQTVFTIEKTYYDKIMPLIEDIRSKKFIELISGQIDKIQVKYNNKDVLNIEKNTNKKWQFVYPAISSTGIVPYDVDSLLDKLNNTNIEKFVADTATDLAPYGLTEPFNGMELYFRMGYLSPTSETRVLVGIPPSISAQPDVVTGTNYTYLKEASKPKVVAVSNSLWDYLKQGSINLRKKSLMDLDSYKVRKLTLSATGKESLVYEQAENQTWKMLSPKQTEAEKNPDLTGLMLEMCHLTVSEFIADLSISPDLTAYGLDNPEVTITMEYGDKDQSATVKSLQIGKKAETFYYARFADDVIIFKMTPSPVETLQKIYETQKK